MSRGFPKRSWWWLQLGGEAGRCTYDNVPHRKDGRCANHGHGEPRLCRAHREFLARSAPRPPDDPNDVIAYVTGGAR